LNLTLGNNNKIQLGDTTNELAEEIHKSWYEFVAGQYIQPPVPSLLQFKSLLEVAYLSTMEMEEGRPTKFTICCSAKGRLVKRDGIDEKIESWPFETNRTFNVQEIRRLAAAADPDSTAIWVQFAKKQNSRLEIHGLLSVGSSWATARSAYSYFYLSLPNTLTVRGLSPGHLAVYQGGYAVGQIKSGTVQVGDLPLGFMDLLGAYPIFKEGHSLLRDEIIIPKHEYINEWHEFEWIAYVNVILAIVNSIKLQGHGGALIVSSSQSKIIENHTVKVKYQYSPQKHYLREAFVDFMNCRHKHSDRLVFLQEHGKPTKNDQQLNFTFFKLVEAEKRLSENTIFAGKLSGTDGALLLTADLKLLGFGTEIRLDRIPSDVKVYKVTPSTHEADEKEEELDSEQFGMRHRSAIKLCSQCKDIIIFVVSQDGGISLIWNKDTKVFFRSEIKTANLNMVLS